MPRLILAFRFGLFGMALCLFAPVAIAEDAVLTPLETADDAQGWEAVGRLDIDGLGFCTGALIAPDLVVTAAHCLFDRDTGERVDDHSIRFLAGWRNGQALAYRNVERALEHPDYVHSPDPDGNNSQFDVALLRLDQPILSTQIIPFEVTGAADMGAEVGIVSYAFDRSEAPSLQAVCGVLGEQDGMLVLSCDVDFGSSGAPIFHIADGVARIVSVVSAKAELDGKGVAIGVLLDAPLAVLSAAMNAGPALFRDGIPGAVRVIAGGERAEIGAKFVRP